MKYFTTYTIAGVAAASPLTAGIEKRQNVTAPPNSAAAILSTGGPALASILGMPRECESSAVYFPIFQS